MSGELASGVELAAAWPGAGVIEGLLCRAGFENCASIHSNLLKIGQIIFADIILSGDNALVIGMAAAGVAPRYRRFAIASGIALAAILRILFALVASLLIGIPGILLLGGLILGWVCWRFYRDLREFARSAKAAPAEAAPPPETPEAPRRALGRALITIAAADVSMSLDNVLAVAAIARHDTAMLVFGLSLAIVLMAFCATIIMRLLSRFPLLSWAGLIFLVYLTGRLLHDGTVQVLNILGFA